MRRLFLCSAIFAAAIPLTAPTTVTAAGWCLLSASGNLCRFRTFEQCMQSRVAGGDSCIADLQAAPTPSRNKASGAVPGKKAAPDATARQPPAPAKAQEQPAKQAVPAKAPAAQTPTPQSVAPQNPTQKFAAARDLVLAGKYEAGIAALQALGFDKHPDVAAFVGLANNKLGRVAEARSWYEKALAGNPKHLLTLSYRGMLHAEQGDLRNAQADLETIKGVCGGTTCKEYVALDGVISSKKR